MMRLDSTWDIALGGWHISIFPAGVLLVAVILAIVIAVLARKG